MRALICLCLTLLFALNVPAMVHAWEPGEGIHHQHEGEPSIAASADGAADTHDRAAPGHHCCATAHVMTRPEPLSLVDGPVLWQSVRMQAKLNDLFASAASAPPTKPPRVTA